MKNAIIAGLISFYLMEHVPFEIVGGAGEYIALYLSVVIPTTAIVFWAEDIAERYIEYRRRVKECDDAMKRLRGMKIE